MNRPLHTDIIVDFVVSRVGPMMSIGVVSNLPACVIAFAFSFSTIGFLSPPNGSSIVPMFDGSIDCSIQVCIWKNIIFWFGNSHSVPHKIRRRWNNLNFIWLYFVCTVIGVCCLDDVNIIEDLIYLIKNVVIVEFDWWRIICVILSQLKPLEIYEPKIV